MIENENYGVFVPFFSTFKANWDDFLQEYFDKLFKML